MPLTLESYERRITQIAARFFEPLRNCYLTTFDTYSTVDCDDDGVLRPGSGMDPCTAFVIAKVAHDKGIPVKGVTSERTVAGRFICHTMPDGTPREDHMTHYVGNFNYFTSHARSCWSLVTSDKVYENELPGTTSA